MVLHKSREAGADCHLLESLRTAFGSVSLALKSHAKRERSSQKVLTGGREALPRCEDTP